MSHKLATATQDPAQSGKIILKKRKAFTFFVAVLRLSRNDSFINFDCS